MEAARRMEVIGSHLSASSGALAGAQDRPDDIVIVDAIRTPITRARKICVGNVLQPGSGALSSRVAQVRAGIPHTVPLSTVNRQCSSGLQAVAHVAAGIKAGHYSVGIAAGVESMSLNAMGGGGGLPPEKNPKFIKGERKGAGVLLPMGITSENVAAKYGITRAEQAPPPPTGGRRGEDAFAAESHARAHRAQEEGIFDDEILPVRTRGCVRGLLRPSWAASRRSFKKGGTTTAGNASQVSDGAAATLLMTRESAAQRGLRPLGVFRSYAVVGVPPEVMGIGPAVAIPAAVGKAGLELGDVDLFELNEAFASQATYCIKELGLDAWKVNPKGGAIALGHPLGCTGCRQVATLLYELRRTGKRFGVVSMCIGTGMGAAAVLELCC
ncbi:3-ketoacyl-CoA thiolase [Ectocarpus siliculosus]|uniref:acetyl-CoA C-acyltransferase n=1 Tax=Ectocarpus siliculosus TaxID=2880 RepID=D7FX87_ECTSI|nr:3-ketoacyl-CoA thiolase [Ectocarpus siliculosus]|eukprot:CBJ49265.1 3-ketoacyl-CoA thiolase [Ectocarpus siliculosus]